MNIGYCEPPSAHLKEYAASLYARRHEGVIPERQQICVENWLPLPNACHDNSIIVAEKLAGYTAIHGWLFIQQTSCLGFVRFVAHSVVEDANGKLIDITPTPKHIQSYPFIKEKSSFDNYNYVIESLIVEHGSSNCLDYLLNQPNDLSYRHELS